MAMTMDINTVKNQMHLNEASGYVFMDEFLKDDFAAGTDVESAWQAEIDRRRSEYLSGKVALIPGAEVFKRAMAKYA